MKYTEKEIQFLIDNYSKLGAKDCAKALGRSKQQILSRRHSLSKKGIKLTVCPETRSRLVKETRRVKLSHEYNVHPNTFINPQTPEAAYILGLVWADGYLLEKTNGIIIEMVREDLEPLFPLFLKTGLWRCSYRNRKNRKPQMTVFTSNKILANFLKSKGYVSKSNVSADQIIQLIPEHLLKYWFRGLSDGDGCFYIGDEGSYQFHFSSSYDQNWDYVEDLFRKLDVSYTIVRRIQKRKNGKSDTKSSIIRSSNRNHVIKFGDYIYAGYLEDKIGLERKYQKYLAIKNSIIRGDLRSDRPDKPIIDDDLRLKPASFS